MPGSRPASAAAAPVPATLRAHARPTDWRWIPRASRVFVNRNLRLDSIGAIGFDLDHTLAHYDPHPVERLAFEATLGKLVALGTFPEDVLDIPYRPQSVIRGLVVDRLHGNLVKTDYFNYVTRACHGDRYLTSEERKSIYRRRRIRMAGETYVSVDTLFHLPEAYLYQQLVEYVERSRHRARNGGGERGARGRERGRTGARGGARERNGRAVAANYGRLYDQIRAAIDEAHADGTIKSVIMADRERFLRPDPQLPAVLEKFRESGKKLFLLTNSEAYYTDALLGYLLGDGTGGRPEWQRYFDLIVCEAQKPSFFKHARRRARARALPNGGGHPPTFEGGDAQFLEEALGFRGDQVLYFGDHTYGDILRSKKSLGWRTAMIVPELTHEIAVTEAIQADLDILAEGAPERESLEMRLALLEREASRLERQRLESDGSHPANRRHLAGRLTIIRKETERTTEELRARIREHEALEERSEAAYNPCWGPLFRAAKETSRFGHQVKDFACIYMARVSCLLHYPSNHYFQSPVDRMPHEL